MTRKASEKLAKYLGRRPDTVGRYMAGWNRMHPDALAQVKRTVAWQAYVDLHEVLYDHPHHPAA